MSGPLEHLTAGTKVDIFEVIRPLGSGGMGVVYLARDTKLGRKVALKVIKPSSLGDADSSARSRERFLHEARITARFNHPHIVSIYGAGEVEGQPYVALEYVPGETLRERLDEAPPGPREALRIARAIADALCEAHGAGILHRDLKPRNVILAGNGRLRVLDFGLAKALSAAALVGDDPDNPQDAVSRSSAELLATIPGALQTADGALAGTPAYMSPEQWQQGDIGPPADLWALGCILFELLAGRRPFNAPNPFAICVAVCGQDPVPSVAATPSGASLPPGAPDLVAQLLDRDPRRRPTAVAVRDALDTMLGQPRLTPRGADDRPPFRGLLAFREGDAHLFFGREADIAHITERLRDEPVVPIVGPSGAGKSSLLHAGIVPRLREQGRWEVLRLRPGPEPFVALAACLTDIDASSSSAPIDAPIARTGPAPGPAEADRVTQLAAELRESPGRLGLLLARRAADNRQRVLLAVDQLEECATLVSDPEVTTRFADAICRAADDPEGPVRAVVTLRDDFLTRLAGSRIAREVLGRVFVVGRPDDSELVKSITEPLARVGYRLEDPEQASAMVEEVSGERSALPLLQFACRQLWERRDRSNRTIPASAYGEIGGVAGALAQYTDALADALPAGQLAITRTIFLRLVTPQHTRAVVGQTELLAGLSAEAEAVLDHWIGARTLASRKRRGRSDGHAEIELVHESLITRWRRLERWLSESRDERDFLADLGEAARLWNRRGRPASEVWQGEALADARRRSRAVTDLPPLCAEFLDAAQTQEARQARRRRRSWAVIIGLLLLVAAASLIAALIASRKEQEVRKQRDRAQAAHRKSERLHRLSEERRIEALLQGARASLGAENNLVARAQLRRVLEARDSRIARQLWFKLRDPTLRWRIRPGGRIQEVAYAPNGRTIAASTGDRAIHLVDVATQRIRTVRGVRNRVMALRFSPDGQWLAAGEAEGTLVLYDLTRGELHRRDAHDGDILSVSFAPSGALLATGGRDKTVRLWSVPRREQIAVLKHRYRVGAVAFHPGGKILATAGLKPDVELWDVTTRRRMRRLQGHRYGVTSLAFNPSGSLLASGGTLGAVVIHEIASGRVHTRLQHQHKGIWGLAFSPSGILLASGSFDKTAILWDVNRRRVHARLEAHEDGLSGLAFSPTGDRLVTGSFDRTIALWRVGRAQAQSGHQGPIYALKFSPSGKLLATAGKDGQVRSWEVASGVARGAFGAHPMASWDVAFDPTGQTIASAGGDRSIRLWDVARRNHVATLLGNRRSVHGLAFGPRGNLLASVALVGVQRVYDLTTRKTKYRLPTTRSDVKYGVAFHPAGSVLAMSAGDHIELWDFAAQQRLANLQGFAHRATGVAFSPAGILAAGSRDGVARIWPIDVATLRRGPPPTPRTRRVGPHIWSLDWHPDGRRVGLPLGDGTVRIWDTQTDELTTLPRYRDAVYAMHFSPDGRFAASGSGDGIVRVFDLRTNRPYWRAPLLRPQTVEVFTHTGWSRLTAAGPKPLGSRAKWRRMVATLAVAAAESADGGLLCAVSSAALELWRPADDRQLARHVLTVPTAETPRVVARRSGCLVRVRDGGPAWWYPAGGKPRRLAAKAAAAVSTADGLWIASGKQAMRYRDGAPSGPRITIPGSVTALGRVGPWLVTGHADGSLVLLPAGGKDRRRTRPRLDRRAGSGEPVTRILAGPPDTIIAGFADGTIGLWSLGTGERLGGRRLHGGIAHLALRRGHLYAVSELGQTLVWDLRQLTLPYCSLLQQVWDTVRVQLREGRLVVESAPRGHACRR